MKRRSKMKNFVAVARLLVLALAVSSFAAIQGSSKRYDMTFVDADFQSVFYSISALAGVDILLAPDVQGRLSMAVTKKTWPEMMDIVCSLHDLTWLVEGNYISVQRTATYQQKIIMESEKREQSDMVAPLVRRSFPIKHASASEMVSVLETIKSARGRISVVERNNAIIAYDTERRLEQMQNTLSELDVETLQISITAKLVVVESGLASSLGIDWRDISVGGEGSRINASFSNTPGSVAAPATVHPTTLTVSTLDRNMNATISNLLSDTRAEILANPQVSTMDHTEAVIFMGQRVYVPSVTGASFEGQTSLEQVEVGIKLTVTPHIAGDNRILLELHPENKSITPDVAGGVASFIVGEQYAQTRVVVSDGETVVIGGLTQSDDKDTEVGIPFLKDIPILGYLFKHTKKETTKKDLIIFVTPRIVRDYLSDSPMAAAPQKAPAASKSTATDEEADDGWE